MTKDQMQVAGKCLQLICEIVGRGVRCEDPRNVEDSIQELRNVLFEGAEDQGPRFEPCSADDITELEELYAELRFIRDSLESMRRSEMNRFHPATLIQ